MRAGAGYALSRDAEESRRSAVHNSELHVRGRNGKVTRPPGLSQCL